MPGNFRLQFESEALDAYCGSGELGNGSSLKSKPYSRIFPEAGTLWSPAGALSGNSLLFGFKTGNFTFVAEGEEKKPAEPPDGKSGPAIDAYPGSAFRFAGFEYRGRSGAASASFSGYIAELPGASSGGGWRPRAEPKTEGTLFGLAAASEACGGVLSIGVWAAASAGYREVPGWAAAAELGFPGSLKHGGTHRKNCSFTTGIFAYAASSGYRSAAGGIPLYDFLADISATASFRVLALSARLALYSLSSAKGSGDATRLLRHDAKPLERLLWAWRNDFLKAGVDIAFSRCTLAARLSLDGAGVREGSVALRNEVPLDKPFSAVLATRADLAFSADGAEEAAGEEENEGDVFDGRFILPWTSGRPTNRQLSFSSFKVACRLGWEGRAKASSLGKGEASLSVSVKEKDRRRVFSAAAGISQVFNIGGSVAISVGIKSPEKGYILWEVPSVLPSLTFGITIRRRSKAR